MKGFEERNLRFVALNGEENHREALACAKSQLIGIEKIGHGDERSCAQADTYQGLHHDEIMAALCHEIRRRLCRTARALSHRRLPVCWRDREAAPGELSRRIMAAISEALASSSRPTIYGRGESEMKPNKHWFVGGDAAACSRSMKING